jgi:RNA binding exosome subunit
MSITGVKFDWLNNGRSSMGVIAQDIEKIIPELVNGSNIKTVNYNGLVGLLIEVVKNQQQQINDLKEVVDKIINT